MKKLELIFERSVMEQVLKEISNAGLPGYSIFQSYKSSGEHGENLDFGFSSSQDSCHLISVAEAVLINEVISKSLKKLKELEVLVYDHAVTVY